MPNRSVEERFWSKVEKTDTCWLWRGTHIKGYGMFRIDNRRQRATRVSLRLAGIVVPKGLIVCHHCDTPACVRPDHLYIGTQMQNIADRERRGHNYHSNLTECPHGHPYDEANTWHHNGSRRCRTCHRIQEGARHRGRPK